jgi:hypothetical protein
MHFLPSTSLGLLGNSDWYICESCSTKGIMYVNHLVKQSLIEWVHHGIINNCELFSFFQNNESLDDFSRHTFTLHSIPTPNNNVSFSNWNTWWHKARFYTITCYNDQVSEVQKPCSPNCLVPRSGHPVLRQLKMDMMMVGR